MRKQPVPRARHAASASTTTTSLVAAVAGYSINIDSPWDGAVYCTETPGSG